MEPPAVATAAISTTMTAATVTTATLPQHHQTNYNDSVDSSPRSRNTDSWEELQQPPPSAKVRLMCSYGGHIFPRPHDKHLSYIGGDTRIFVTDRNTTLAALSARLSKALMNNRSFTLKYQLPNEDLDSLISVTTDEDLDNMIEEYDRIINMNSSSRLRLFLFPTDDTSSSIGNILEKSDDWFVHALNNGASSSISTKVFSECSSVNCLLGLDDDIGNLNLKVSGGGGQDVLVDRTSSFGSTCSTTTPLSTGNQRGGGGAAAIEEQKQEDGGFVMALSTPDPTAAVVSGSVVECGSRIFSDDDRSEHRKTQPQLFPKPCDLQSPDSVSSEGSAKNPLSMKMHYVYQEQQGVAGTGSRVLMGDPNGRGQVQQQVQDAGYALPVPYDQHPQMHQYVHAGQYIHHTPSGPVPMTSYFPMYHSQQQQPQSQQPAALEHQYPIYFLPARPAQAYSLPVQQTNYSEPASTTPSNRPQTPPPPAVAAAYNPPLPKHEMVAGGAYRTAAAQQLIQINSGQHHPQYVGYSQIHHPSQSMAPTSVTAANYAYEFADPTHVQIYYTQPLNPQFVAQYQTVTSSPAVVSPESSSQLPTENVKQQIRTSQP